MLEGPPTLTLPGGSLDSRPYALSPNASAEQAGGTASPVTQALFAAIFGKYHRLFRMTLLCIAVEAALAGLLWLKHEAGAPQITSPVMISAWSMPFLGWLGIASVQVTRRRVARPTLVLYRLTRLRKLWFARAGAMVAASSAFGLFFSMVKSAIPSVVPFWADRLFARADRILLGDDAWRVSDRLLGDMATVVLDRCYLLWFPAMFLTVAFLFATRNERLQAKGLFTFFAAWLILGSLLATLGSSVGPILYDRFYHAHTYGDLLAKLDRVNAAYGLDVGKVVTYLSNSNTTPKLGGGIAAMPSMHVGVAFLNFLVFKARGGVVLPILSGCFFVAIFLGSIDLGWHYLVDGLASVVGVYLLWAASEAVAERIDRAAKPNPVATGCEADGR